MSTAEELPIFKYSPKAIEISAFVKSEATCPCCERKRGYINEAQPYTSQEVEGLCPWCISDGSAAKKYNATFQNSTEELGRAGVSTEIIKEVAERTPGYVSWQGEDWQAHCSDACEYHGEATKEDLYSIKEGKLKALLLKYEIEEEEWNNDVEYYESGGNPTLYKFVCRHCGETVFTLDND